VAKGDVSTSRKLVLLAGLYLSQGLPFGFFTQSLPVLLRQEGVSLAAIGSASLLAMPWGMKFLWAPYVDRYGGGRWGRRRSWILPLQALSVCLLLALAQLDPHGRLLWLFVGVFCANLLAATQDIATDALAVELLPSDERGLGNGVQVAGFRLGMIVGGGLLLVIFDRVGRSGSFEIMAALLALCSLPIAFYREEPRAPTASQSESVVGLTQIIRTLTRPNMRSWLFVLVFFKAGDAFGTAMLRPLLVDAGSTLSDIGWLLGTLGALAGLSGALCGGLALRHVRRPTALLWFGAAHGMSLLSYGVHALYPLSRGQLYLALGFEHFLGGMATVALFTCMMDRVELETAGTDYTLQASVVAGASGVFGLLSGLSAQTLGYGPHFAASTLLAFVGAVTAWALWTRSSHDLTGT
jgi:PAT family beta-lactamase induction signal transducer AmpG